MIDQLSFLGKNEEVEFGKLKFSGKNAGKIFKYREMVDKLIRARAVIFGMVLLSFFPVLVNFFSTGEVNLDFLIERLVFAAFFLIAGLLFNRFRLASIALATIPTLLIIAVNSPLLGRFNIYGMGFGCSILLFVLGAIYFNRESKKLERVLRESLLENQLIE